MKGKSRYKAKGGISEKVTGSVYTARWKVGKSEDVRMRHLLDNDYGKKAAPERPMPNGLPGMPRRTMIHTR